MAVRPPSRYAGSAPGAGTAGLTSLDPIDHEIAGEKAAALGRAGERVEKALAGLGGLAAESPERPLRLKAAADAVYAYFVQRELCGFRRHQDVIREYAIPPEVLARLGAS